VEIKAKDLRRQCDIKRKGIDLSIKGPKSLHHISWVTIGRLFHLCEPYLLHLKNEYAEHVVYASL
jgi:hypothetical protein